MTSISTVKSNDLSCSLILTGQKSPQDFISQDSSIVLPEEGGLRMDLGQENKISDYLNQINELREQMARLKQTQEFILFD